MTMTSQAVDEIVPIAFGTDARELADRAYEALFAQLDELNAADWAAPTDCPDWDVSAMVGHMIGAARAGASIRESLRQQRWGRRHRGDYGGNELDAVNDLQVREHAALDAAERVAKLREMAPKAVKGRMKVPRPMRGIRFPMAQGGSTADGMPASLTLGELMSVIYTRDTWLHRVDIARATQRSLVTDPALDSRIVADVVREWASRHGQPFQLVLTGIGGGEFRTQQASQQAGSQLTYDAVEFCRILSGRAPGEGLLATRVLF